MRLQDFREALLRGGIITDRQVVIDSQDEPVLEDTEQAILTPRGYERRTVSRPGECAGCMAILHTREQVAARCVDCGRPLCARCAQVVCSDPYCGRPICPDDRTEWWDGPLCREHSWARLRGLIIRAVLIAAAAGGLLWWIVVS